MATSTEEFVVRGTPVELVDAFRDADLVALARLTAEEREEHRRARSMLFFYLDQLWDEVNPRHGGPGGRDAAVIAGMRDIAAGLSIDIGSAQREAGDLDD